MIDQIKQKRGNIFTKQYSFWNCERHQNTKTLLRFNIQTYWIELLNKNYPNLRACPPARSPSSPKSVTCSSSRAGSAIWTPEASRSAWWHIASNSILRSNTTSHALCFFNDFSKQKAARQNQLSSKTSTEAFAQEG